LRVASPVIREEVHVMMVGMGPPGERYEAVPERRAARLERLFMEQGAPR
jgi:hypothetical protein